MGAPRSRTPDEPGARDIAGALYPDVDSVDWIPSDDADVFRLSFTSGRAPRILKMATHGIRAVWREIGAFPAMRRLGIPEVLQFEHTSEDLPDLGIEFHVTRELANPQQASRAMAELWINDQARALDVAHWLGDCTGRIESLHWRRVPRANSPEQSVEIGADWRRPQYGQLLARSDCPAWARTFIDQASGTLSRHRRDRLQPKAPLTGRITRFVLTADGVRSAPRGHKRLRRIVSVVSYSRSAPSSSSYSHDACWRPAAWYPSRS